MYERRGWVGGICLSLIVAAASAAAQTPPGSLRLVEVVDLALRNHPDVLLQSEQIRISEGRLQEASGQFDLRPNASVDRTRDNQPFTDAQRVLALQGGSNLSSTLTNLTTYDLGFVKQYRTGLTIAPTVQMTRQDLNVQKPATNRATATFQLSQPLLRGRGTSVVTSPERAARLEVDAASLDLGHTRSTAAVRTVLAYWQYVASLKNLRVLQEAEARAQRIVDEMQVLIDADNQPAANLKQPQANLANRRAQRLAAEQGVFEARQALGLAAGVPYEQIVALPLPADDFPDVPPDPLGGSPAEAFVDRTLSRRTDLQALDRRRAEARVLAGFARDSLKPQLDLVSTIGYAGLDEGNGPWRYLSPFAVSGLNASMGFTYGWPTSRQTALGAALRTEAVERQATIQRDELARSIRSGVAVARDQVQQTALRVTSSRAATALYQSAIGDERVKLQIGLATVLDVILTEDRLTQSLLDQLSAELSYAQAVARLRFETDTLLGTGSGPSVIDFQMLTTVPPVAVTPGLMEAAGAPPPQPQRN